MFLFSCCFNLENEKKLSNEPKVTKSIDSIKQDKTIKSPVKSNNNSSSNSDNPIIELSNNMKWKRRDTVFTKTLNISTLQQLHNDTTTSITTTNSNNHRFSSRNTTSTSTSTNTRNNKSIEECSLPMYPIYEKSTNQIDFIYKILISNYLFSQLTPNNINSLISSMQSIEISKNQSIITNGEDGDIFYIIEVGEFNIYINNIQQNITLISGQCFGELALIYQSPRQATIIAKENSKVFSLDRQTFRNILTRNNYYFLNEKVNFLKRIQLFNGFTNEQYIKLANTMEMKTFQSNEIIIQKSTKANTFYMIQEGLIKISDSNESNSNDSIKKNTEQKFNEYILQYDQYFGEKILNDLDESNELNDFTAVAISKVNAFLIQKENLLNTLGPISNIIDMNKNLDIINKISLFICFNLQEKMKFIKAFILQQYPNPGMILMKQGEKTKRFYIIKQGCIDVIHKNKDTNNGIGNGIGNGNGGTDGSISNNVSTSYQLSSGQYFGELTLLHGEQISEVTMITTCPCQVYSIKKSTFIKTMQKSLQEFMSNSSSESHESHVNDIPIRPTVTLDDIYEDYSNSKSHQSKSLNNFIRKNLIGKSNLSKVILVHESQDMEKIYALKMMKKNDILLSQQQDNILNEKKILTSCSHPFIVNLYETFRDETYLYYSLEFIPGGDLYSILHTPFNDSVSEYHAKFYSSCIVLILQYLHSKNIVYRNIKPENCLLDKMGYLKLIDFRFSKIISFKTFTLCGTLEYLAPEMILGHGHDHSIDYWALGILIYEMLVGYTPFIDSQGMDPRVICKNIVSGKLFFPKNWNSESKVSNLLILYLIHLFIINEYVIGFTNQITNKRTTK